MAENRTKEEVEKRKQELKEGLEKTVKKAKELKEEIGKLEKRSHEIGIEVGILDAMSRGIEEELEKLENEEKMTKVQLSEPKEGQSNEELLRTIKELTDRIKRLEESSNSFVPDHEHDHRPMIVKYGLPDAPRAHLLKFGDGRTRILDSEEAVNVWINDLTNEQPIEIWEMKKRTRVPATAKV